MASGSMNQFHQYYLLPTAPDKLSASNSLPPKCNKQHGVARPPTVCPLYRVGNSNKMNSTYKRSSLLFRRLSWNTLCLWFAECSRLGRFLAPFRTTTVAWSCVCIAQQALRKQCSKGYKRESLQFPHLEAWENVIFASCITVLWDLLY